MSNWTVTKGEAGLRLPNFIQHHLGSSVSLKQIKKGLEENGCRLNGRPERFASTLVKEGDKIEFSLKEENTLKILFEDAYLAIVNKPPFVVSDADKGILGWKLAHRLDKETSGCLLLAKTEEMEQALQLLFKERKVKKEYLAVVDGKAREVGGLIQDPIASKEAITRWKRDKTGKVCSWIKCYPETGRTHQIRIHLANKGLPILGDWRYCKNFKCAFPTKRILLHSVSLKFVHPKTGEMVSVNAPIPKEFDEALSY